MRINPAILLVVFCNGTHLLPSLKNGWSTWQMNRLSNSNTMLFLVGLLLVAKIQNVKNIISVMLCAEYSALDLIGSLDYLDCVKLTSIQPIGHISGLPLAILSIRHVMRSK